MSVTSAQVQQLIIAEVGDTADGDLLILMPTIWSSYADKASVAPRAQELYAKRRAIDVVLGTLRGQVDVTVVGDFALRQGQAVTNLLTMRKTVEDEIALIEARAQSSRGPVVGQITAVAPVSAPGPLPTLGPIDGNDPALSGTPYRGLPWPR